jgi:xanthine dehydrogenase large subunit
MAISGDIRGGVHAPRRHDSADKQVSGAAVYADDVPEPRDMLHCYIAMSARARARLTKVDLSEVRGASGVVAVISADDIPGDNNTGPVVHDEPMLAASEATGGEVHYAGQALFVVAAESIEQARAAAKLAVIGYSQETPILTIAEAMAAGSLLQEPYRMARGDARAAIDGAPRRLEGRITFGGQDQFYLESQIAAAWPGEDEDVHIVSSNQHPSECQHIVAHILGVSSHAVTVEVRRLGGGFGGKETQGNLMAGAAALVAKKTGRPAKVRLDRDDDMILTGKRHAFVIDYEVGFDDEGRIEGIRFDQMGSATGRCSMPTTPITCRRPRSSRIAAAPIPSRIPHSGGSAGRRG